MSYESFALLFMENFEFNLLFVFLAIGIVVLIYRKHIYSVFDPLLFFLIFSSAGYSVVFILFLSGDIKSHYATHFLLTQMALIMGFLMFKPFKFKEINKPESKFFLKIPKRITALYCLSGFLYLTTHFILYAAKGVPLFMHSRLDAAAEGFGFALSVSSTTSVIVLSYLGYKFLVGFRFKVFDYLMSLSFIVFSILSGSKSVFIESAFILFYVAYFISVKLSAPEVMKKFNKASFKIFLMAFLSLVVITLLFTDEDPFVRIVFRFIMAGDIYMMSYVDDNINTIDGDFLNLALPYSLVNLLGLEHVAVIGNQLVRIVYGVTENTGPNARHNVLGYVAFGYCASILFSFFIGAVTGFMRNKLIALVGKNMDSLIFFVLILSGVFSLEVDLNNAIFSYISKFIVYALIFIISFVLLVKPNVNVNNLSSQNRAT